MIAAINPTLQTAFHWLLRTTWQASLLAVLVLAVQAIWARHLSARARCALWLIVIVRLLLPPLPTDRASLFPFLHAADHRPNSAATVPLQKVPSIAVTPIENVPRAAMNEIASAPPLDPRRVAELREALKAMADSTPSAMEQTTSLVPLAAAPPEIPARFWPAVYRLLPSLWLAGVIVLSLRIALASVRLSWKVRRLRPLDDPFVRSTLESCAVEVGLRRPPAVVVADDLTGPALAGFWAPKLLLPWHVVDSFSAAELRLMLLHELGHIRRRDVLASWVLCALGVLHWFNPVLLLSLRRMRADRELACDEIVLATAAGDDRRAYGHTLLRLAQMLSARGGSRPMLAGAGVVEILEDRHQLQRRIVMISRFNPALRSWPALVAGGILFVAAVALTDAAEPSVPPAVRSERPAVVTPSRAEEPSGADPARPTDVVRPGAPGAIDARIDDRRKLLDLQVAAKNAEYDEAMSRLKRLTALRSQGAVSEEEVEHAQTEAARAKAALALFLFEANQLNPPVILAPATGSGAGTPPTQIRADTVTLQGGVAVTTPGTSAPGWARVALPSFGAATIQDAEAIRIDSAAAEKLRKPMAADLAEVSLREALHYIADHAGVDLLLDGHKLDGPSTSLDNRISLKIKQPVAGEQLLRWVLRDTPWIGYTIDHGVLFVSVRDDIDHRTVTRVYDTTALDGAAASLPQLVQEVVAPGSWRETGGLGIARLFGDKLLVTQTQPNHAEIEKLFGLLRAKSAGPRPAAAKLPADPNFSDFFAGARSKAAMEVSTNHMRQILIGAFQFAEDHNGMFPPSLAEIRTYLGENADELLANPRNPQRKDPWVYVAPTRKLAELGEPSKAIILYEANENWGDGLLIGYADGHVELEKNRDAFLKRLHLTPRIEPPAAKDDQPSPAKP